MFITNVEKNVENKQYLIVIFFWKSFQKFWIMDENFIYCNDL